MENVPKPFRFDNLPSKKFDVVLYGINMAGALLAWRLAAAGKRVALFCPGDFPREDDFRFTRIFPDDVKSFPDVRRKLHFAADLQHKAPHLFLQQRMVWLRNTSVSNTLFARSYNQMVVHSQADKAGTLKLKDYPDYRFFYNKGYTRGILCREYRYNYARMVIELLKAASREGAFIVNFVSVTDRRGTDVSLLDELTQECLSVQANQLVQLASRSGCFSRKVKLSNHSWSNPVRLSGNGADFVLFPLGDEVVVTAYTTSPVIGEPEVWEEFFRLFSLSGEALSGQPEPHSGVNAFSLEVDLTLSNGSPENLAKELPSLFPGIGHEGFPDLWFRSEENRHISQVIELAQQKFYEAKQTGIGEAWFMELFYRYGPAIEELTELAFEGMSRTRDPQVLWKQSIREYRLRHEWSNDQYFP